MPWDELYIDSLHRELEVAHKWAGAWKGFARRCRGMIVKEMVELQQAYALVEDMLERGRNNPGLLLAALVLEAAKEGLEVGSRASECMGWAFAHYLSNHPEAPNYLEVTLEGGDNKPIYVTVQRPGGKTPHQLRVEAEADRDKLRIELESLKALGECRS
jgi:hypothetical protein